MRLEKKKQVHQVGIAALVFLLFQVVFTVASLLNFLNIPDSGPYIGLILRSRLQNTIRLIVFVLLESAVIFFLLKKDPVSKYYRYIDVLPSVFYTFVGIQLLSAAIPLQTIDLPHITQPIGYFLFSIAIKGGLFGTLFYLTVLKTPISEKRKHAVIAGFHMMIATVLVFGLYRSVLEIIYRTDLLL